MCYRRFTLALRYQLQALLLAGHTRQEIAKQLVCDRSTISREVSRVTPYDAELAEQDSGRKQSQRHRSRIAEAVWDSLTESLKQGHSPEQIHGRRQKEGQACPSPETIYRFVYASPDLSQYLRRGRKHRQPRSTRRHSAMLWQSISGRSTQANERSEIGHLEADLMEGAKGKGSLVVIVDRCSRLLSLNLVMTKTAPDVYAAMNSVLDGKYVKTITIDQGREFVLTECLGQHWNAQTYACHAHSPWEKGSVENSNGLLRQFFPKGTDFTKVSLADVLKAEYLLNNRPRKILGYRTPYEVHCSHQSGALAT